MTSSFAPNFPFPGGPNNNNGDNEVPVEGSQEIFRYNPYSYTGVPTWFDWIGITDFGTDAIKNTSAPGKTYPIFRKIPDDKLKTERPYYSVGNNEIEYGGGKSDKKCITYAGQNYVKNMFDNTQPNDSDYPKNWGWSWNDYYSSPNKWWQFYSAYFANYSDELYPFAVKGISCRLKTPQDKPISRFAHIAPSHGPIDQNWGDHTIINQAHGLWRDLEGYYYIFELLPYGDNSLAMYSDKGTAGRNFRNVWTHEGKPAAELYGPDASYIFPRKNNQTKKNAPLLEEVRPYIKPGAQKALAMWTMNPAVENLFFCGVNIEMHHDKKAGKWRPHTTMISRVTPVPFHMPRHDKRTTVVLGEPTHMDDLKKGFRKIHFWNPPEGATDTLGDYIEPPYDPKGEDTVGPEDTLEGGTYVLTGPYFPDTIDTTASEVGSYTIDEIVEDINDTFNALPDVMDQPRDTFSALLDSIENLS